MAESVSINRNIQGLRAICVLAVFAYHIDSSILPGGYLGVDFFFVLSGYLMAKLLVNQFETKGEISVIDFYRRRMKRLLPAMFFVATCTIPIAFFTLLPSDMRDFSASLVGVVTLTLNKMIANNIGYFTPLAETQPLLHFWSLMVELQFYLIIPLIFWAFVRIRWFLVSVLVLFSLVSIFYADYLSFEDPKDNYFMLPSRLWELCFGCLLFYASSQYKMAWARGISSRFSLLLLLSLCFAFFDSEIPHPSLISFVPILIFSALLVSVGSTTSSKFLGSDILVWIGNLSFSIYLWHYVLIVAFKSKGIEFSLAVVALIVVLTIILSLCSYRWIEKPFWKRSGLGRNKWRARAVFMVLPCLIVSMGLLGFFSNGFEKAWLERSNPSSARAYELVKAAQDFSVLDVKKECTFRSDEVMADLVGEIEACSSLGRGTLVIGDSHAIGVWRLLATQLESDPRRNPFLIGVSRGGCKPYQERKGCSFSWIKDNAKWVSEHFDEVIYVQRGTSMLDREKVDFELLVEVDEYLSELSRYVRVTWLGPRIESPVLMRQFISDGCDAFQGAEFDEKTNSLVQLNGFLDRFTREKPYSFVNASFVDLPRDVSCDSLYWRDSNHWSPTGIQFLSERLQFGWWHVQ